MLIATLRDRLAAAGHGESGRRPVPAVGARVARRAVPVPPARRGAGRRRGRRRSAVSWRYQRRSRSPTDTKFKVPAGRCAERQRRAACSGWSPGDVGDDVGAADVSALREAVEAGQRRRRSTCSTRARRARSATSSWIVEARARHAAAAHRAGRAADRPGARGRFRAAGRIVRREGSVLYERPGTAAGRGARDRRRRARRMEDWQILVNLGAALGVPFDYASAAHVRADIAARFAASPELDGHRGAGVRRPVDGAALAAGVESVGALEVGLHVPGSAAGQRRGRSERRCRCRRARFRCKEVEVSTTHGGLVSCRRVLGVLCVGSCAVSCCARRRARSAPAARRGHAARRADGVAPARRSALALQGRAARRASHPVEQAARSDADPDGADASTRPRASRSRRSSFRRPTDLEAGRRRTSRSPSSSSEFAIGVAARRSPATSPAGDARRAGAACAIRPATRTSATRRRRPTAQWTLRVVRRARRGRRAADDAVFATIRVRHRDEARPAAPVQRRAVHGSRSRDRAGRRRRDATLLDDFTVLGTTGGYLGAATSSRSSATPRTASRSAGCSRAADRWRFC